MSAVSPCAARPCGNFTTDTSGVCYAHRHLRTVTTPRGAIAFRGGGALDLAPRLAREAAMDPPRSSAGVPGFPYATHHDIAAWQAWRSGTGARPEVRGVIDRMPLELPVVPGGGIRGDELGIYDASGALYLLGEPDGRHTVLEEVTRADGSWVRTYRTEGGTVFAVRSGDSYQVVRVDESLLPALSTKGGRR